jgi:hypothetical protein
MKNLKVLDQVLEHVDLARWGYRKSQLVRLVATLQDGPNPAPLGRQMLQATGRSARQARYDHELLMRLSEDAVLMRWRGQGRRPDSWALAPIESWRRVPWIGRRREVLRVFSCPLPGATVGLWTKSPGRSGPTPPETGENRWSTTHWMSVDDWSTTDPTTDPSAQSPVDGSVGVGSQSGGGTAPSPFPSVRVNSLPPYPPEREGGSVDRPISPGSRLLEAVRRAAQTDIVGAPAARIVAVGQAYPEMLGALVAYAGGMGWVRAATMAARLIEEQAETLARPASPEVAGEAVVANLRQRIANLAALAPDDEHLPGMRAELEELERSLSALTGRA